MTRRWSDETDTPTNHSPDAQQLRPTTIVALGGFVACALFIARDPVALDRCQQMLHDHRLHQRLLDAIQRLGHETTSEVEGGIR